MRDRYVPLIRRCRRRDRIAVTVALLAPVAVCAGLIPVRTTLVNTDAALVLVAFTVAVAALGRRLARRIPVVLADSAATALADDRSPARDA
ncbi:hypothetical protein [Actinospica sp.]|jgi:hypothetical protein|uniref:hypothetical protein n=1 Tax=Actinospica sp. TaxID=1872142 RepID=UPI002B785A87|nr:hypothetical protein [Actinospica sp.]HWG27278.1 hypothetical protein [Actinospica sp.]